MLTFKISLRFYDIFRKLSLFACFSHFFTSLLTLFPDIPLNKFARKSLFFSHFLFLQNISHFFNYFYSISSIFLPINSHFCVFLQFFPHFVRNIDSFLAIFLNYLSYQIFTLLLYGIYLPSDSRSLFPKQ